MGKFIDLTGQRFGRLVVVKRAENRNQSTYWLCKCDCDSLKEIKTNSLRTKFTKSCGCLLRERAKETARTRFKTHGESKERFYKIWKNLRKRCLNPNDRAYKNYGGRGIKICKKWEWFENFRDDMHESYLAHCKKYGEKNTTIDRVNNDGNYKPSNCRWATQKIQSRNTRRNVLLTYKNKTKSVLDWANEVGLKEATLYYRVTHNWSLERALTTPKREHPLTRNKKRASL